MGAVSADMHYDALWHIPCRITSEFRSVRKIGLFEVKKVILIKSAHGGEYFASDHH
jgi:hypothetical protein